MIHNTIEKSLGEQMPRISKAKIVNYTWSYNIEENQRNCKIGT